MKSEESKFLSGLINNSGFKLKNEVDLYNNIDNIVLYDNKIKKSNKIASLFERILMGHYLIDGNKRLAFQFLLHYQAKEKMFPRIDIEPNLFVEEYKNLVVSLENNNTNKTNIVNSWIEKNFFCFSITKEKETISKILANINSVTFWVDSIMELLART